MGVVWKICLALLHKLLIQKRFYLESIMYIDVDVRRQEFRAPSPNYRKPVPALRR